jgi:ArsR family transcriptional regulator, arsenate/arsenite/antimonite-responsive transcriptional repressor
MRINNKSTILFVTIPRPLESEMADPEQDPGINLHDNTQMFKALGDETRIRMLGLLIQGELCVCDIMEVLNLPQSTASRHLAYLKNARWVAGTRRGKWMYYQLDERLLDGSIHRRIVLYLSGLKEVQADHRKLLCLLQKKDDRSCK